MKKLQTFLSVLPIYMINNDARTLNGGNSFDPHTAGQTCKTQWHCVVEHILYTTDEDKYN